MKSVTLFGFNISFSGPDLAFVGLGISYHRGTWPMLMLDFGPFTITITREPGL